MAERKRVAAAIVKGPNPYFAPSGKLYGPRELVTGDDAPFEDEVAPDASTRSRPIKVKVRNQLTRELVEEEHEAPYRFIPADAGVATAQHELGDRIPDIATGNEGQRLNVNKLLDKSVSDIEATISSGKVDVHLGAIEQAEIAGKARKAVLSAVKKRSGAIAR